MATPEPKITANLPPMDPSVYAPPRPGIWNQSSTLLATATKGLIVKGPVSEESLRSIPSIWARPLLFGQALAEEDHPQHAKVQRQWRGLLGLFCFREIFAFELTAARVECGRSGFAPLDSALTVGINPIWLQMWLIYLDGRLIAGTSPRSLLFPVADAEPIVEVPWTTIDGRFDDPLEYFKEWGRTDWSDAVSLLGAWVSKLRNEVSSSAALIEPNDLARELTRWYEETSALSPAASLESFSPGIIKEGVFAVVTSAVPKLDRDDSDFTLDATRKLETYPIVVSEEEWKSFRGFVRWPHTTATIEPPSGLSGHSIDKKIPVPWVHPGKFLTDKIVKMDTNPEWSLWRQDGYILPLKEEILRYFHPEDVAKMVEVHTTEEGVQATLYLPVKTRDKGRRHIKHTKTYKGEDVCDTAKRPVPYAAVWPNFVADRWNQYYVLVESKERLEYSLDPIGSTPEGFPVTRKGSLLWSLPNYPDGLRCTWQDVDAGLVLLMRRSAESWSGRWTVSLDFGTSNTAVFFSSGAKKEPERLEFVDRVIRIIPPGSSPSTKFAIFTEFMPNDQDPAVDGIFPSIYRDIALGMSQVPAPLEHGIVLFDDPAQWLEGLRAGELIDTLKWSNDPQAQSLVRLFLSQVMLMIAAEARDRGIREVDLWWSYPLAFPPSMVNDLTWAMDNSARFGETGIAFDLKPAVTESTAVCQYKIETERAETHSGRPQAIIDIGGGTSDIAIWALGKMEAQCSLKLAGRILLEFARERGDFFGSLAEVLSLKGIEDVAKKNPASALNLILKHQNEKLLGLLAPGGGAPHDAFKRARGVILFGLGAVFYYVGMLLRSIHAGRVGEERIDIHLAGNGSGLLNWVHRPSVVYDCVEAFVREGARPLDLALVRVFPGKHPKEEVARGLLYSSASAVDSTAKSTMPIGEIGYLLNGASVEWSKDVHEHVRDILSGSVVPPAKFENLEALCAVYDSLAADLGLDPCRSLLNHSELASSVLHQINLAKDALRGVPDAVSKLTVQPFFVEEVDAFLRRMSKPESTPRRKK